MEATHKLSAVDIKAEVIKRYHEGAYMTVIATQLGIAENRVYRIVRGAIKSGEVSARPRQPPVNKMQAHTIQAILDMYRNGVRLPDIAVKLQLKDRAVRNQIEVAISAGAVPKRPAGYYQYPAAEVQKAVTLYNAGIKVLDIAEQLRRSKQAVYRMLQRVPTSDLTKLDTQEERRQTVIELYKRGLSHSQIGKVVGCKRNSVSSIVSRLCDRGVLQRRMTEKSQVDTATAPAPRRLSPVTESPGKHVTRTGSALGYRALNILPPAVPTLPPLPSEDPTILERLFKK